MASLPEENTEILNLKNVLQCVADYAQANRKTSTHLFSKELTLLDNMLAPAFCRIRLKTAAKGESKEECDDRADDERDEDMIQREMDIANRVYRPRDYTWADGVDVDLVLISHIKKEHYFANRLTSECNGVIIDPKTWRPVVVPLPALSLSPPRRELLQGMPNYNVFKVRDGTNVNLFYRGADQQSDKSSSASTSGWSFSTNALWSAAAIKWIGPRSYKEIFCSLLANYGLSLDSLDKRRVYSFGFRHHDFHPFTADPQAIWINKIAMADDPFTSIAADDVLVAAGIKEQQPVSKKDVIAEAISLGAVITDVEKYNAGTITTRAVIEAIEYMNKNAFNIYAGKTTNPSGIIHYGYVLRGNLAVVGSDILLESSLLQQVRRFIYDLPKANKGVDITPDNRLNFAVLRAALQQPDARNSFSILFPNLRGKMNEYLNYVALVAERIFTCLRKRNTRLRGDSQTISATARNVDALTTVFLPLFSSELRVDPYNVNARSIIRDCIENRRYLNIYFKVLCMS